MTIDYLPWNRPVMLADRVCMRDTRLELTYAEVARRVDAVAEQFAAAGVGRGDVVAVMLPNRVELLLAPAGRVAAGRRGHPGQPGVHAERGGLPDRRLRGQADDRHWSGRQLRRPGAGGRRPRHHPGRLAARSGHPAW